MIVRLVSLIVLLAFNLPAVAPPADAKSITIERIVAKINEEIVTLSELQDFIKGEMSELKKRFKGENLENHRRELELTALDLLVEQKLVLQRAKDANVGVSDKELESAVQSVLDKNGITIEKLTRSLRFRGSSIDAFKKKMSKSLLVRKIEGREVNFGLSVNDEEIVSYYKANADQFRIGEARHVRQIFLPVADNAPKSEDEAQRKKADAAHQAAVNSGQPFADIAKKFSGGPAAVRSGDLGFIKKGEIFPEFEKIVFLLQVGKISDVVRTRVGYHIILIQEKRPGKLTPIDQVSGKIRNRLYVEKRAKRRREWLAELKRAAFLEINFNPHAVKAKLETGAIESIFRDIREQISFRLVAVKLLGASDLLGREKLFWTYGSSRRDERWESDALKVDEKLGLGRDEIGTLESIERDFINPDPGTNLYIYEYNYLL
ncbi:MAG: hypothetical protein HOE85_11150, partial [Nitrospinaceae bacterium]|nr:hypothetical protein [Nitrospinaceae bacterium]